MVVFTCNLCAKIVCAQYFCNQVHSLPLTLTSEFLLTGILKLIQGKISTRDVFRIIGVLFV
jgi:hypothetical protein